MIYFQTSNRHKFKEVKEILGKHGIKIKHINKSYQEIQAETLEEVVAEALNKNKKRNVVIEDSGLFIKALDGFPGVYSSYVLKTLGNEGILKLLEGVKNRTAEFHSIIGFKASEVKIFKGAVRGNISFEIRGKGGFGYDPIFIPLGCKKTFAEDIELKMKISHRRRALDKLIEWLKRGV